MVIPCFEHGLWVIQDSPNEGVKKTKKDEKEKIYSLERIRVEHPNAYRAWNSEEEAKLQKLFNRGIQMREMAETLGRKPGGIRSRLKKLGLTEG